MEKKNDDENEILLQGVRFLYNQHSPKDAANFLIEVFENENKYLELSENSKEKVARNFNIIDMVKKTEKLYNCILNKEKEASN